MRGQCGMLFVTKAPAPIEPPDWNVIGAMSVIF